MKDKQIDPENADYLSGQLLIAMPQMEDPRFSRTVIYICAHTEEGAMGIILNRFAENINFCDLMEQLNLPVLDKNENIPVHFGGPMETGRGFVLHSADFIEEASLLIEDGVALTATVDMLRAISNGTGPKNSILALGYAGWAPGQLDEEIQANGWLSAPADFDIIFGSEIDKKWVTSLFKLGIDISMLSGEAGHA
ncbi:MAG: hypothetical protein CMM44_10530 [Rhodospirillaceae bacterium]|nr:hypothetical protein [Rhodospirillaceae bacterium]|tara:strand:- start:233 stop:817 length:585 start_codon:yes stop_codon:yes gene_type:complete